LTPDVYIGSDQKTIRPVVNLFKRGINSITKINANTIMDNKVIGFRIHLT